MTSRATGEFEASTLRTYAQRLTRIALLVGADAQCCYANPAWVAFTGLDLERSLGHGWQLAVHPQDITPALADVEAGTRGEQPYEIHCRLRSAHNEYAAFSATFVPMRDAGGTLREWLAVCDRSDPEHDSDARLRSLADALPLLVWTTDSDDRLTFVNRAWLDYTGLPLGASIEDLTRSCIRSISRCSCAPCVRGNVKSISAFAVASTECIVGTSCAGCTSAAHRSRSTASALRSTCTISASGRRCAIDNCASLRRHFPISCGPPTRVETRTMRTMLCSTTRGYHCTNVLATCGRASYTRSTGPQRASVGHDRSRGASRTRWSIAC